MQILLIVEFWKAAIFPKQLPSVACYYLYYDCITSFGAVFVSWSSQSSFLTLALSSHVQMLWSPALPDLWAPCATRRHLQAMKAKR